MKKTAGELLAESLKNNTPLDPKKLLKAMQRQAPVGVEVCDVKVTFESKAPKKCFDCRGTGKAYPDCHVCKGEGGFYSKSGFETCTHCEASYCRSCEGVGER